MIEVIVVINVIVDGEVILMYILWVLKLVGIKVIWLVRGLVVGLDIEYVDEVILFWVIENCIEL